MYVKVLLPSSKFHTISLYGCSVSRELKFWFLHRYNGEFEIAEKNP